MTDTQVEESIINKFLTLEELTSIPKCFEYYQSNKEKSDSDCLNSFIAFKPNLATYPAYPDYESDNPSTNLPWTEAEIKESKESVYNSRALIDAPLINSLITWFTVTYPSLYGDNSNDDALFDTIKGTTVTISDFRDEIDTFNRVKNVSKVEPFPNVAFQNSPFTRPVDASGNLTYWYELYFIPGAPFVTELGTKGRSRWVGIMQVNICIPKTYGTKELNTRYDEIAKLFKSGTYLNTTRITRTYRSRSFDESDFYCMPVTIEWNADLDR